jgi:SAM-dependent methyltransferase
MNPKEYEIMFRVEDRYWWYRGMRALVRSLLPEAFGADRSLRLLDAGCGTGANLAHVKSGSRGPGFACGVDLSPDALRFSHRRGLSALAGGSVTGLPFADGEFDLVTCHDVLSTVPDDVLAIGELARVLSPGGLLYVTVAAFESLGGEHDRAVHGLRRYRRPGLVAKLQAAGLTVERATYANTCLAPAIWLHRRLRSLVARADEDAEAASDFPFLPRVFDEILYGLLRAEAAVAARISLPFGVTLAVRARKRHGAPGLEGPSGAGVNSPASST